MSSLKDPRVLFAAERTLLAWNRTSISFMAFGFAVERVGLFIKIIGKGQGALFHREFSFYIGILFIALAILITFLSILQYKNVLLSLNKDEIPEGFNIWLAVIVNFIVGLIGIALIYYVYHEF
jgi:putative membrane protein